MKKKITIVILLKEKIKTGVWAYVKLGKWWWDKYWDCWLKVMKNYEIDNLG